MPGPSRALSDAVALRCRVRHLDAGASVEFGRDELKRKQWAAFLRKNRLDGPVLDDLVAELAADLQGPLLRAAKIAGASENRHQ